MIEDQRYYSADIKMLKKTNPFIHLCQKNPGYRKTVDCLLESVKISNCNPKGLLKTMVLNK
jgi:hypothetical protein